jgi:hypothetical protein
VRWINRFNRVLARSLASAPPCSFDNIDRYFRCAARHICAYRPQLTLSINTIYGAMTMK